MKHQQSSGFIALLLVIVIGSALLAFGLNSSWLSLSRISVSSMIGAGDQVSRAADGCLAFGLLELRRDNQFAVSAPAEIAELGRIPCIIEVMVTSPLGREIVVTASEGEFTQTIWAAAEVSPRAVSLVGWRRGQ